jgi:hypothetical protein
MSFIARLVDIEVASDISDILRIRCGAEVDLSLLPENVKSQTVTYLKRGWTSSISGRAFTIYQILATRFDFPVFSVGRAEKCIISYRVSEGEERKQKILSDLQVLWKLANPEMTKDQNAWRWRFHTYDEEGHRPEWRQLYCTRPQILDVRAVCNTLEIDNLFQIVPKDSILAATRAIETGETIDISPWLRRKR